RNAEFRKMPPHTTSTNLGLCKIMREAERTVIVLLGTSLQQQVLAEGNTQPRLVHTNGSQLFVVFVVRHLVSSRFQSTQFNLSRPILVLFGRVEGVVHLAILLDGVALRRVVAVCV